MEERFLHAWDELDDTLCLCRQLATLAVSGAWDNSRSFLAGAAALVLAGTATVLPGVRQFFGPSG
jgi:hypothetical protein